MTEHEPTSASEPERAIRPIEPSEGDSASSETPLVTINLEVGETRLTVHGPRIAIDRNHLVRTLEAAGAATNPALRAFLTLPDVNALDPALLERFADAHVHSYFDLVEAVRDLAELDSLEEHLYRVVQEHNLPDAAITIEYSLIEQIVRSRYDVIDDGNQVHVFER